MSRDSIFPFSGELPDDPDIYHILSVSTAGADSHGYKQVWLTTGGNNPSYPYAGGDNPVPVDDWDDFEPDHGFEKISLKNAFFDTSIKTFGASPSQAEGADDSCMLMKDHQGYTWFYGTIFQQAMIPDGLFPGADPFLAAASESLKEGQMSMLVNDKNQYEVFSAEDEQGQKITYCFIEDPWGNEYIAQGTNTSDVNSAEPGSAEALAELFSGSVCLMVGQNCPENTMKILFLIHQLVLRIQGQNLNLMLFPIIRASLVIKRIGRMTASFRPC